MIKELNIGNIKIPIPIFQGGMAVRISTAPLAAAVANEGGLGVIAGTGMSLQELRLEIRKARELSQGIIGVNVLFAVNKFAQLVKTAISEKVDFIISGAGISRDMYRWGREGGVSILPIVSSGRLARMAEKFGAAGIIVEGKEAGGHLGTDQPLKKILPEVKSMVKIPVIAAGGMVDAQDIREILNLGADGVQLGTRFAASEESNASPEFKELYVRAESNEVALLPSPVGLPGRGIVNAFSRSIMGAGKLEIKKCFECLKQCSRKYCIMDALNNACSGGDYSKALIFSGTGVGKIKEILPVREIFKELKTAF